MYVQELAREYNMASVRYELHGPHWPIYRLGQTMHAPLILNGYGACINCLPLTYQEDRRMHACSQYYRQTSDVTSQLPPFVTFDQCMRPDNQHI